MNKKLWMILAVVLAAMVWHVQVSAGVLAAGERCVRILIPSLYLYSILAAVCTKGGLLAAKGRGGLMAILLFSQFGGYPVGAQLLHGMRKNGCLTAEEERWMLCVCMGCGPGFLLGTVCSRMPLCVGLWMLLSVSLPNLLAGALLLRNMSPGPVTGERLTGVRLLTGAVESAADAMLRICGMILAVAAVLGIGEGMGLLGLPAYFCPAAPELASAFVRTLTEVSCITEYMQQGGSLPMAAALLSFGGICVHLQAAAICDGELPWLRFWCVRVLCSVVSWGLCCLGTHWIFPDVQSVFLSSSGADAALYSGSAVPGVCLLVMSVLLLRKHNTVLSD